MHTFETKFNPSKLKMPENYFDHLPEKLFTLIDANPNHPLKTNNDFWLNLYKIHLPFFLKEVENLPPTTKLYQKFKQNYDQVYKDIPTITRNLFAFLRLKKTEEFIALLNNEIANEELNLDIRLNTEAAPTLLHVAAQAGLAKAVDLLLAKNPESINAKRNDGPSVLDVAAHSGDIETVKLLLSKKAIIQFDRGNNSALSYAMLRQHELIFDILLNEIDLSIPQHQEILKMALRSSATFLSHEQFTNYARKLLIKGARFAAASRNHYDFAFYKKYYSPIITHKDISHRQHAAVLRELLDMLSNDSFVTREQDEHSNTAYPLFIGRDDEISPTDDIIYQLIEYLIKEGPKFILPEQRELPDHDGVKIRDFAYTTQRYLPDVYALLLDREDFDINSLYDNDHTQLMTAVIDRNLTAVNLLISKRCDLNVSMQNTSGDTALSYALRESGDEVKRANILCLLFKHGAGLYAEVATLPSTVNLDNVVVIGMKLNKKPVSRTMRGFENAITTPYELFNAIKAGVAFELTSLINSCQYLMTIKENNNELKKIIAVLKYTQPIYILNAEATDAIKTANTLNNLCLNAINHTLLFKPRTILPELTQPELAVPNDMMDKLSLSHAKTQHKRTSSVSIDNHLKKSPGV